MPRWIIGVISHLVIIYTISPLWAQSNLPLSANSCVIMDADTGKVLLSRNSDLLHPPASTIKVATALMALSTLDLDDSVKVSRYAASAPPSKIYIRAGKTYTVQDLLYGLLLGSGNDAARALAEKICGTESRFGKYMTKRVREWGAYRSNFKNASGLPAEDQYSTARDLAVIMRRAMFNPTFARIMGTKNYAIGGGQRFFNHDRFLFTIPYAVGGKTGYTRASQHTYVGMFENRGRHIIISVMGSNSKNKWADRRVLIEKGFALCGTPIAQLAPLEEQLHHQKLRYAGRQPKSPAKKKYVRKKPASKKSKRVARRPSSQGNSVVKASIVSVKDKKVRSRSSSSKPQIRSKNRKHSSARDRNVSAQIRVAREP
ncbi:MAG: D-alanyl-D-alanine carboxypeptidase family protein [Desulfobacteraceae bacterium]